MSTKLKTNRAIADRFAALCRPGTLRLVPEPGYSELEMTPRELCLCWLAAGSKRVRDGQEVAWRYLVAMFTVVEDSRINRIRLFNLVRLAGRRYERLEYAFPQLFELARESGPEVWEEHFAVSPGDDNFLRTMMFYSIAEYGARAHQYLHVFARCPTISVGLRREFLEEICRVEKL